jgi:glucosamine kinase
MRVVVGGVDGGGSKTRVVLADERGQEIASAEGPASAVRGEGGAERSAEVIVAVVRDALERAELPLVAPKALCVGVAGVGREPERQALHAALTAAGVADEVVVQTDALIALDDAFGEGAGVLLIAGTGSVAFGRGPDGTFARCGGWGPVIGDEGSGAWIGRRAVNVVASATDGREPDTQLVGAVLTALELESAEQLVEWATRATPADFAALAPAVTTVAAAGDLRANAVLSIAVEELVLHVRTLARRLFVDERAATPIALVGGLLGRGAPLRRRLEQRMKSAVPGALVRSEEVVPARGAVRGALRALGVELG